MCVVCGCSEAKGHGATMASPFVAAVPRTVSLEASLLGANDRIAGHNREHFAAHGVVAINLLSSPGSGKTTLLCATLSALQQQSPQIALGVIEGDQQTSLDADRIRETGTAAVQVNTGKGCHLDAQQIAQAFDQLPLHRHSAGGDRHASAGPALLMIENVGNLVCPALWDLGERAKVVVLSVTEGEDKPLKYPDMFAAADLLLLNKIDLLPHLDFDVERCLAYARRVRPGLTMLPISARSGAGMPAWLDWLRQLAGSPTLPAHGA